MVGEQRRKKDWAVRGRLSSRLEKEVFTEVLCWQTGAPDGVFLQSGSVFDAHDHFLVFRFVLNQHFHWGLYYTSRWNSIHLEDVCQRVITGVLALLWISVLLQGTAAADLQCHFHFHHSNIVRTAVLVN